MNIFKLNIRFILGIIKLNSSKVVIKDSQDNSFKKKIVKIIKYLQKILSI